MATKAEITKEIEELIGKLAKAKLALEEVSNQTTEQSLAEDLHSMLCVWNHTDGCGWFYETGPNKWSCSEHARYLGKAVKLISKCRDHNIDLDDALDIIKVTQGV